MDLRRYCKLTWGPSRRILEIFLSIAEPMLLYAALVWIRAIKFRWCVKKLRSVQRLMLMTIIRSFRSISTRSGLVLTNSLLMEKKALHSAALATLKGKCFGNKQPTFFSVLQMARKLSRAQGMRPFSQSRTELSQWWVGAYLNLGSIFEAKAHTLPSRWRTSSSPLAKPSQDKTIPLIAQIHRLALQIRDSLMVSFHWVPGHQGVVRNEIVNKKARAATENPMTTTKRTKIAWSSTKETLGQWLIVHHRSLKPFLTPPTRWKFCNSPTRRTSWSRFYPDQMIRWSHLRSFLKRIGVSESGLCSFNTGPETIEHFLFDCVIFQAHRTLFKNHRVKMSAARSNPIEPGHPKCNEEFVILFESS